MIDYIILFLSWAIYFFIHSVLAADELKDQFIKAGRVSAKTYRLIYTLISSFGLLGIMILQLSLISSYLIPTSELSMFIGLVLATYGLLIIKRSFRYLSLGSFLGVKEEDQSALVLQGIHKWVRHPIYSGTILIVLGALVFVPSDMMLVSTLSIIAYLPVGIMLEEQKLVKRFGADYFDYRKSVPAIFPKISSFF